MSNIGLKRILGYTLPPPHDGIEVGVDGVGHGIVLSDGVTRVLGGGA